jgi:peptidoglycan hydrolase-like protein with peptidoglycan-binding domain
MISFVAFALVLGFVTIVSTPNSAVAAPMKFDKDLSFGIKNSAEVKNLQKFLSEEGYFKGEATGNYFNLTAEAVKAFQKANKISSTGYFGPVTRATVNSRSADALLSITSHKGGEKIEVGNKQTVTWGSTNYDSSDVKINIIKKVSSNPNRYELVRVVSDKTLNDGSATWVPAKSDIGNSIFVEVGCTESKVACRAAVTASSLAVIDSTKFANTASAFNALEKADNR